MGTKAREYKPATVRRLDLLSGNQCASPTCEKSLIAKDGMTIISKICHIEAANTGGARYNDKMTDDDRRHYNNLILLCDECHSIVDNVDNELNYSVKLLRQWKTEHESKMMIVLSKKSSLLIEAINAISNLALIEDMNLDSASPKSFPINEKISYNSIVRNKFLIDDYKIFYSKINALYDELENQGNFKKENLLRYIKNLYLPIKGKYIKNSSDVQKIIRLNSDNIIEDIQETLSKRLANNNNVYSEDVDFGISVIIVDAFMRCKILEEPK